MVFTPVLQQQVDVLNLSSRIKQDSRLATPNTDFESFEHIPRHHYFSDVDSDHNNDDMPLDCY